MKRMVMSFLSVVLALFLFVALAEPVFAEGSAPVAENLELKTYRNVSVGGTLSAYDPDGGTLRFTITTEPVKGSIQLAEDGSFVYTPRENKKGRDYFGYKAVDEAGNSSQEATVIIKIERQKKEVSYADMRGSGDEYAALALCESGLFTGEQIGGKYCFYPQRSMTRGEFLSLCMQLSDKAALSAVRSTGYADDRAIPAWLKGAVSAAKLYGVDSGHRGEEGTFFDADMPVTLTEAAEMLDRALNVTSVSYSAPSPEQSQACLNLAACGVLNGNEAGSTAVTRAQAARMLTAAMELLTKRQ